ncbi:MAG: glycosyltransferase family 4 protein [Chitinophagales bacterium]
MNYIYSALTIIAPLIILSFIGVRLLVPKIIAYAFNNNLTDKPNDRKVHHNAIPRLGGIAFGGTLLLIFTGYVILDGSLGSLATLIALSLIFITGLMDDIKEIKAKKKFVIQIVAAVIIASEGIRITHLWGLFGINELSIFYQYVITVIILVGITNSFNLIDGIDGLAAGIGLINSFALGCMAFYASFTEIAVLNFTLAGGLFAFLFFNFNPAKIFMGDSGSTLIGFLMGVSALYLATHHESFQTINVPIAMFGILLLPVFDTIRILVERIIRGVSPFTAEKNHIHHLLLETGLNHKKSSIILYISNILIIIFSMFIQQIVSMTDAIILTFTFGILLFEACTIKNILYSKKTRLKNMLNLIELERENTLIK